MSYSRRTLIRGAAAFICAPAFVRHVGADEPRFALGIASGHPQPHSLVLWTRLSGEQLPQQVPVHWELAHDAHFRRVVARGNEIAHADSAHSVHAEPAGLTPGRWYFYRFQALGQQSATGRTRTAPEPTQMASLNFCIASCQRWESGHYAAWRHLAQEPLDLVLFLGDYIYERPLQQGAVRETEGGLAATLAQYRARYATYKSDPALQAAHAAAPWLMVWDDHEVHNDYANLNGPGGANSFALQRAAAYQAYWEHMPFPKSVQPRNHLMRITGQLDWGRLARIHLLDERQYRDPQACAPAQRYGAKSVLLQACPELLKPERSLLGMAQERWLAQGWSLTHPWNLVAQQTLMAQLSWSDPAKPAGPTYWSDGWDGYAPARSRLLNSVAQRQVPGVVVLGGDVHAHCVADLKLDFNQEISPIVATEFCGTSISSTGLPQRKLDEARAFNPHLHYARSNQRGYMHFALNAQQLQVKLQVLHDPKDIASGISTAARFNVEATRPGAVQD
jgi:alkaline phosphatase D